MQSRDRFAPETALFEAMLPELMATNPHKWFVAWDGKLQAVVDTLDDACKILDQQPEDIDVMVREISTEQLRLPLHFASAK
jgi:hypothetical protein